MPEKITFSKSWHTNCPQHDLWPTNWTNINIQSVLIHRHSTASVCHCVLQLLYTPEYHHSTHSSFQTRFNEFLPQFDQPRLSLERHLWVDNTLPEVTWLYYTQHSRTATSRFVFVKRFLYLESKRKLKLGSYQNQSQEDKILHTVHIQYRISVHPYFVVKLFLLCLSHFDFIYAWRLKYYPNY